MMGGVKLLTVIGLAAIPSGMPMKGKRFSS
jgi:hypothetical protein